MNELSLCPDQRDGTAPERIGKTRARLPIQAAPYLCRNCYSELNRNSVTDLLVLTRPGAMEYETIWEALQACRLSDSDRPVLAGMGVFAGFRVSEPGDDRAGHAVPGHAPVTAGMVLAQGTLHARRQ
jgi:hypothetical protein